MIKLYSLAILLRILVSLWPYSGEKDKPRFGDFEAQRHWMEITVNLPPSQWYANSTDNDLQYWGLDYPPFSCVFDSLSLYDSNSAYVSKGFGHLANAINQEWVRLHTSRGFESEELKLYMRLTVIFADLILFFPAIHLYSTLHPKLFSDLSDMTKFLKALIVVSFPALILIDHGHFQYNSIAFSFILLSCYHLIRYKSSSSSLFHLISGTCCCLTAVLFKHTCLYYAPAFFFYVMADIISRKECVKILVILIISSLAFVFVSLLPYLGLSSIESWTMSVAHLVQRLFPVNRGIFQGKIGNFWCFSSVLFDFRAHLSQVTLAKFSSITTLLSLFPVYYQAFHRSASLPHLLALSSLSFFLFSFQVHEKAILMPVLLLLYENDQFMHIVAIFSMYPLFVVDKLLPVYVCLLLLSLASFSCSSTKRTTVLMIIIMLTFHLCEWMYYLSCFDEIRSIYPDLFHVLNIAIIFVANLFYLFKLSEN